MDLRNFNIREASWHAEKHHILALRKLGFGKSSFSQADEYDKHAWHWIATDVEDRVIGSVRITPTGDISHLLVLPEYQGQKAGKTLIECTLKKAIHLELVSVQLSCPMPLMPYFQKMGFKRDDIHSPDSSLQFPDHPLPDHPLPGHQRMNKSLEIVQSISQRTMPSASELNVQVRDYDTAEVDWNQHRKAITFLRHQILIVELGLNKEDVSIETNHPVFQFVTRKEGQLIGAVQLEPSGKISYLIVDADYRRRGIASSLLEAVEIKAQRLGIQKINCKPDNQLVPFLQALKFEPERHTEPASEPKKENSWTKEIVALPIDRHSSVSVDPVATQTEQHQNILLGQDDNFLLLRSKDEFQKLIVDICQQAKHSLQILSPFLDHALFDQASLRDICSALARKNKYTRIEILLFDPHRVIKNGHCLVELSRRLPSSMNIRVVHPEMRNSNHEYVIVDGCGYIYRQEVDLYEGSANFYDITESNRLSRQFRRSWESSLTDPNLRQLKL